MSDVEDRLRSLLRDRAATAPPDNPARRAEVRSRITGTRRRRVAGTALGLVLVTVTGLLVLTQLRGRNESLPPAVPKPPYFTATGKPKVPGYFSLEAQTESGSGHEMTLLSQGANSYNRYLVVAWCSQPGALRLSLPVGETRDVPCKTRVDDHFEGALEVGWADAERLFVPHRDDFSTSVSADGAGGRWRLAVLRRDLPDRLPDRGPQYEATLDGTRDPDGGTFRLTVPRAGPIRIGVECVEGVELTFTVPAGELAAARCELDSPVAILNQVVVPDEAIARLGLRRGQPVLVTVRRSGTDTDQWRVTVRPPR